MGRAPSATIGLHLFEADVDVSYMRHIHPEWRDGWSLTITTESTPAATPSEMTIYGRPRYVRAIGMARYLRGCL